MQIWVNRALKWGKPSNEKELRFKIDNQFIHYQLTIIASATTTYSVFSIFFSKCCKGLATNGKIDTLAKTCIYRASEVTIRNNCNELFAVVFRALEFDSP